MRYTVRIIFVLFAVLFTAYFAFADSPYTANADNAVLWLSEHQNTDGSWGNADDIKLPCTVSAVSALRALNQRTPSYYWGIAWLENHHAPNIDYTARRILALSTHGDNVQNDMTHLQAAQMLVSPGNSGWGLTDEYQGTPLDSAIALLASSQLGVSTNIQPALDYLKGAQLTGSDKGWAVAQESTSDPQTTALVLQSMINYTALDPSLSTNIDNGILSLAANVNTSSPIRTQALAALTYIRAGYTANATPLLDTMASSQSGDGSWSQDPYVTAVAVQAFAAAMETDLEGLSEIVDMPDNALRAAINAALGKNSMDALTKGDMANLITLDAAGMGINDLTGMEWAVNLASADFSNNNITDTTPLDEIPGSPVINLDNNPGTPPPDMPPGYPGQEPVSVPALSVPALIITIAVLIVVVLFIPWRKKMFPLSHTAYKIFIVFASICLSSHIAAAENPVKSHRQGLEADKISQIRGIGKTVLMARKNVQPDPQMDTLRQSVKELRRTISALALPSGKVSLNSAGKIEAGKAHIRMEQEQNKQENGIRNSLDKLRLQRGIVEQDLGKEGSGKRYQMKLRAAEKVQEIEDEVEQALQSPEDERIKKLKSLEARLASTHRALTLHPAGTKKAPTISTITHHRK